MPCKQPFPLTTGAILGSNGNMQMLTDSNGISCTLMSLPGMSPMLIQHIVAHVVLIFPPPSSYTTDATVPKLNPEALSVSQ